MKTSYLRIVLYSLYSIFDSDSRDGISCSLFNCVPKMSAKILHQKNGSQPLHKIKRTNPSLLVPCGSVGPLLLEKIKRTNLEKCIVARTQAI